MENRNARQLTLAVIALVVGIVSCGKLDTPNAVPAPAAKTGSIGSPNGQAEDFARFGPRQDIISAKIPPNGGHYNICFNYYSGYKYSVSKATVEGWVKAAISEWWATIPQSLTFSWYTYTPTIQLQEAVWTSPRKHGSCNFPDGLSLNVYYDQGNGDCSAGNGNMMLHGNADPSAPCGGANQQLSYGWILHEVGHEMGLGDTYDTTTCQCQAGQPASVMCGLSGGVFNYPKFTALMGDDTLGAQCTYCEGGPFGGALPPGCRSFLATGQCNKF